MIIFFFFFLGRYYYLRCLEEGPRPLFGSLSAWKPRARNERLRSTMRNDSDSDPNERTFSSTIVRRFARIHSTSSPWTNNRSSSLRKETKKKKEEKTKTVMYNTYNRYTRTSIVASKRKFLRASRFVQLSRQPVHTVTSFKRYPPLRRDARPRLAIPSTRRRGATNEVRARKYRGSRRDWIRSEKEREIFHATMKKILIRPAVLSSSDRSLRVNHRERGKEPKKRLEGWCALSLSQTKTASTKQWTQCDTKW